MKSSLLNNLGLKLLSVILAVIVWVMIMNSQDPTVSRTIKDVPVSIVNGGELFETKGQLESKGFTYIPESGEKIDIKVKGRRSVVDNLTVSDFEAHVDFKNKNKENTAQIEVTCLNDNKDDLIFDLSTNIMSFRKEDSKEKDLQIFRNVIGKTKEGYFYSDAKTTTEYVKVTVSGSETYVDMVDKVVIDVDITDLASSVKEEIEPYAVDKEGKKIDPNKIGIFYHDEEITTIEVEKAVYRKKAIQIKVKSTGTPGADFYCDEEAISFTPKEIYVAGSEEYLNKLDELVLDVSIAGVTKNKEVKIELESELNSKYGSNLELTDATEVVADLPIKQLVHHELSLTASDIRIVNASEGYDYILWTAPHESYANITGRDEAKVKGILASELDIYVDAEQQLLEPGKTISCSLKSDYSAENIEVSLGTVSIEIREKIPAE